MTGLMFIPLALGVLMSAACAPFVNKHYLKISKQHRGKPPAEKRLIPMMWSCWLIPIGLFIFAWTSYPRIHWIGPAIGGWPVGFGFIFLYNSANNYLGMCGIPSKTIVEIDLLTIPKSIPTNTRQRLPLQPRPFSGPCGGLPLSCSQSRCIAGWAINGQVRS